MKRNIAFTIDEDLIDWINNSSKNKSEFANEIFKEAFNKNNNITNQLATLERKEKVIETERLDLLTKLEQTIEEGNKKEREQAEQDRQRLKELLEEKEKEVERNIQTLKESALWDELLECKTAKEIDKFTIKAREAGIKLSFPKLFHLAKQYGGKVGV